VVVFCVYLGGRPDNLLTNFVTWRGMLTKIMCSPYNKSEPWKLAASLYHNTIYLSEVETDHALSKMANETERMKEMSYWGLKFEDYVTSAGKLERVWHNTGREWHSQ